MRILIRPVMDPQREIDLTERLVAAIAEELWRLYGGNDQLNWLEAERHLARLIARARTDEAETIVLEARPETRRRRADSRPRRPGPRLNASRSTQVSRKGGSRA